MPAPRSIVSARSHPVYRQAQARIARRVEAYLNTDTTVDHAEGITDRDSGAILDTEVPGQTGREAGKSAINPSVKADRTVGEPTHVGTGIHGNAGGVITKVEGQMDEAAINAAQRTTVGIFPGCFVQVFEKGSGKRVDRNIVSHVRKDIVVLRGGEEYDQNKYTFKRLA